MTDSCQNFKKIKKKMENYSVPIPQIILKDCVGILELIGAPIPFTELCLWYTHLTSRDLSKDSYQYGFNCPEEFLDKSELFVFLFQENRTYVGLHGHTLVPLHKWEELCEDFKNFSFRETVDEQVQVTTTTETETERSDIQKIVEKSIPNHPQHLYRSHYTITVANSRRP